MQNTPSPRPSSGKAMAGFILLAIGAILLMHRLDFFFFPGWLFSWPMILILIGLFIGAKHQYRNPAWFILVAIGTVFLIERFYPYINFSQFTWPLLFILIGLYLIFGRNRSHRFNNWSYPNSTNPSPNSTNSGNPGSFTSPLGSPAAPDAPFTSPDSATNFAGSYSPPTGTTASPGGPGYSSDFLSSTSIFGGVKKNIISKNFQGGEIVTFLGGAEINLSQADIKGRVILDVTQVLGGTKIIVPAHWDVVSEVAAVFGGVEDKRFLQPGGIDHNKVLVIRGTSLLGGIDIRSY